VADEDRVLFVAGLEAAVVDAYRALLDRGSLPAELADTVLVLAQHHDEHCTALAAIAGTPRRAVERNEKLREELLESLAVDDPTLALLGVEEALTSTHLASLGVLEGTDAVTVVASILPVEARHGVVLDPQMLPPVQIVGGQYEAAKYA
jgi:hypothetical protein